MNLEKLTAHLEATIEATTKAAEQAHHGLIEGPREMDREAMSKALLEAAEGVAAAGREFLTPTPCTPMDRYLRAMDAYKEEWRRFNLARQLYRKQLLTDVEYQQARNQYERAHAVVDAAEAAVRVSA